MAKVARSWMTASSEKWKGQRKSHTETGLGERLQVRDDVVLTESHLQPPRASVEQALH